MEKNVYLLASEHGAKNQESGISYNEMLDYLRSKGVSLTGHFEEYFQLWFYNNFYVHDIYRVLNSANGGANLRKRDLEPYDQRKGVIMDGAYSEYLDYLKLEQAKKDAKQALKLSRTAIWITAGLTVLQIMLQLFMPDGSDTVHSIKIKASILGLM